MTATCPVCHHPAVARSVLVVDDHAGFRSWARRLLEMEGLSVVGEAPDAAAGVQAVGRLRPDVVLLDVHLPDADGFQVARLLAGHAAVVLVSSQLPDDICRRVDASGAAGFVGKADLSARTLAAVLCGCDR